MLAEFNLSPYTPMQLLYFLSFLLIALIMYTGVFLSVSLSTNVLANVK